MNQPKINEIVVISGKTVKCVEGEACVEGEVICCTSKCGKECVFSENGGCTDSSDLCVKTNQNICFITPSTKTRQIIEHLESQLQTAISMRQHAVIRDIDRKLKHFKRVEQLELDESKLLETPKKPGEREVAVWQALVIAFAMGALGYGFICVMIAIGGR